MPFNFDYIDRLINDPTAIIYVRDAEGRYVWVNDIYGQELPHTREEVMGKTNRELHGDGAQNWEIADSLTALTGEPITTAEDLYDTKRKQWRKFVSTKLRVTVDSEPLTIGISVEVREPNAQAYQEKLGRLRAKLIERMEQDAPVDDSSGRDSA